MSNIFYRILQRAREDYQAKQNWTPWQKFVHGCKVLSVFLLAVLVMCSIVGFLANKFIDEPRRKAFDSHKKFTVGKFLEWSYSYSRSGTNVKYKYSYKANGILYQKKETEYDERQLWDSITNKTFPVIYDSLDPDHSYLLIFPDDFKVFNMVFPDSLKWVKRFQGRSN